MVLITLVVQIKVTLMMIDDSLLDGADSEAALEGYTDSDCVMHAADLI